MRKISDLVKRNLRKHQLSSNSSRLNRLHRIVFFQSTMRTYSKAAWSAARRKKEANEMDVSVNLLRTAIMSDEVALYLLWLIVASLIFMISADREGAVINNSTRYRTQTEQRSPSVLPVGGTHALGAKCNPKRISFAEFRNVKLCHKYRNPYRSVPKNPSSVYKCL